jgi:ATP synthase protein I
LAACLWDLIAGKSTLLGCLIFALPTLYFSHYAFRYRAGEDCASVARSFYWGQASKISLVTIGFALVFVFIKPLNTYALFLGFCLMIPAHVVCATFVSKSLAGTCR